MVNVREITRKKALSIEDPEFIEKFENEFNSIVSIKGNVMDEPTRLLQKQEYSAAIVSVMSNLERTLRLVVDRNYAITNRFINFSKLLNIKLFEEIITRKDRNQIYNNYRTRSQIIHEGRRPSQMEAEIIVKTTMKYIKKINEEWPISQIEKFW